MPEIANCPLCGKKPFPYHYADHIEYVHCGVKCEDEGTWCEKHNQYARTKFDCPHCELDELRERVAWMLECDEFLEWINPTNRRRAMFCYPEMRHIFNAAREAVEELL